MYIEVPVIGSGTLQDPYRADLGVAKSAIIPTDKDGRPLYTTALVRVDNRLDNEIDRKYTRIPDKEGLRLVRQLDPKLDPKVAARDRVPNEGRR